MHCNDKAFYHSHRALDAGWEVNTTSIPVASKGAPKGALINKELWVISFTRYPNRDRDRNESPLNATDSDTAPE